MSEDIEKVRCLVELVREHCVRRQIKLVAHECSMCNYPCGFYWDDNMELIYDSGCFCTKKQYVEKRPINDIIHYISNNVDSVSAFLLEFKEELS